MIYLSMSLIIMNISCIPGLYTHLPSAIFAPVPKGLLGNETNMLS